MNKDRVQEHLDLADIIELVTNMLSLQADEALIIYRRRDTIEKLFDCLKNELDFGRFKTHSTQVMQGKFLIGFIALILQSHIQRRTSPALKKKSLLFELEKI